MEEKIIRRGVAIQFDEDLDRNPESYGGLATVMMYKEQKLKELLDQTKPRWQKEDKERTEKEEKEKDASS